MEDDLQVSSPQNALGHLRSGFLSFPIVAHLLIPCCPSPAQSRDPQHDVLTSVLTYKAGFPYIANHPKRVLITSPEKEMLPVVMADLANRVTVRVKVDFSNPSVEGPEIKMMYLLNQTLP
jgi:hypothetical protein